MEKPLNDIPASPRKILLTGIGGFIGIHTLGHIMHNTDWDVVGIDSFRHKGLTDRLRITFGDHPEWKERTTIFTHDLAAPLSPILVDEIGDVDYIINMASESHVDRSIQDPPHFIQNNVNLTVNMLEYARKVKPRAFIQISTDEVYGPVATGQAHPEWSSIVPSNPYSASKAAQEAIAISYWRTFGVPLIITNTMNNFGEMQDPEKYPAMVLRQIVKRETVTVHGAAGQIGSRFYLHARNHADALLFILQNTAPHLHRDGHIDVPDRYNIVGEQRLDNLELAQLIADIVGDGLKYELVDFHSTRPGHDRDYGLDGSKLANLGWVSPVSLEDGLRKTIEWTLKNRQFL